MSSSCREAINEVNNAISNPQKMDTRIDEWYGSEMRLACYRFVKCVISNEWKGANVNLLNYMEFRVMRKGPRLGSCLMPLVRAHRITKTVALASLVVLSIETSANRRCR